MPAVELLLVRHGESTWNAVGRWQGWADPPLSDLGRAQAEAAAPAASLLLGTGRRRARYARRLDSLLILGPLAPWVLLATL